MKKSISNAWIIFCWIPIFALGQTDGIHFEKGLSWAQVQAKARAEGKYIFLDCYTTWCGPCKEMEKAIYPLKEVGDYYNDHFINVAVQMDQKKDDPQAVKDWYGVVPELRGKYHIDGFPTYLYFTPDGTPVHKVVGAILDVEQFIGKAKDAANPSRQYYTVAASWRLHDRDSAYLLQAQKIARDADDQDLLKEVVKAYFASLPSDPSITKENVLLMAANIQKSSDKEFRFFLTKETAIDAAMQKPGYAACHIGNVVFSEEVEPLLSSNERPFDWLKVVRQLKSKYPEMDENGIKAVEGGVIISIQHNINVATLKKDAPFPDWNIIADSIAKNYPGIDPNDVLAPLKKRYYSVRINLEIGECLKQYVDKPIDWSQVASTLKAKFGNIDFMPQLLRRESMYFAKQNQWVDYDRAIGGLFRKYRGHFGEYNISEDEAANMAWDIFLHSDNKQLLDLALDYIKTVTVDRPADKRVYNDLDTYANLLYKTGRKQEAIQWENNAIESTSREGGASADLAAYKVTLAKMERGEKTWGEN